MDFCYRTVLIQVRWLAIALLADCDINIYEIEY